VFSQDFEHNFCCGAGSYGFSTLRNWNCIIFGDYHHWVRRV